VRTYRTTAGPFTRRPYFTDEEFETICADELMRVGLLPPAPEPIRIERFIEKRFEITVQYGDLPDPLLGVTVFGESGVQEILVARALDEEGTVASQRRARTTLAHEAGHGILHTHLFALDASERPLFADFTDPIRPRIQCKVDPAKLNQAPTGYTGNWQEFQANRAMSCLLLPRPLVQQAIAPFCHAVGTLGQTRPDQRRLEEATRALADRFDVNPQVVRFRLTALYPDVREGQQHL
jgi:hypothetical protein